MKILLAEDDRDMAKGISVFLGRNHYTVDTVDNGMDAYDYLSGGDYNMAVLDIMMPGMSGIEVLKKIRKEGNKIPILLLTTMREAEERINGLKDAPSSEQTAWRGMISSHGLSGSFRRRSEPYYDRRRVRRRCFRRRHLPDHRNQYARGHDVCAS